MAPSVFWHTEGRPGDPEMVKGILAACEVAAAKENLATFKTLEIWNALHTSRSDARNHTTVHVKTTDQTANNKHQVAHIYIDRTVTRVPGADGKLRKVTQYAYNDHDLYPTEKRD